MPQLWGLHILPACFTAAQFSPQLRPSQGHTQKINERTDRRTDRRTVGQGICHRWQSHSSFQSPPNFDRKRVGRRWRCEDRWRRRGEEMTQQINMCPPKPSHLVLAGLIRLDSTVVSIVLILPPCVSPIRFCSIAVLLILGLWCVILKKCRSLSF